MQQDPTIVMLDQLWRVIASASLDAVIRACVYAPMAYLVVRLALRKR